MKTKRNGWCTETLRKPSAFVVVCAVQQLLTQSLRNTAGAGSPIKNYLLLRRDSVRRAGACAYATVNTSTCVYFIVISTG